MKPKVIANRTYEWRYRRSEGKECPEHGTVIGLVDARGPFYGIGQVQHAGPTRAKNPTHLVCEDADCEVFYVPLGAIKGLSEIAGGYEDD